MAFALGIDIGGTFTDIVVVDASTGAFEVVKTLTTYPDPSEGVLDGLSELFTRPGMSAQDVTRVIHGTTLVTNTLIERKGAKTALVTTQGFRDALEIGREGRYDIYDLRMQLPKPLVERRYRLEVDERLNPDGSVRSSLNTSSVAAVCDQLRDAGVESVGVCLLHAYANPDHETILRDAIADHLPGCPVTLSSEVAPELREFERSSTTVANAYVQPLVERYLGSLGDGLANTGVNAPLHVMLSNGGSCSVETAEAFPVRLVESGPCGGALAAAGGGREAGLDRVLAFDMGGTTAKAVLTIEGTFPVTTESEVARVYRFKRGSGLPLLVPVLDMIEIGAGGGSIAHVNALGLPAVGPESAGSSPGPACYDRGGDRPTVTDADLLLGYLNSDYFLGGSMSLSVDRAGAALSTVADQFGGDALSAAHGIHQLVNENMASAARVHAAERGVDLRSYALVATGGAGPVHACGVASRLGIDRVLVPPIAGVGSAFGLLLAPISFDFARSYVCRVEDLDIQRLRSLLDEMLTSGREVVTGAGVADADVAFEIAVDIRYVGQGHEIRVLVEDDNLEDRFVSRLVAAFESEYARLFGRTCEGVPIEVVHWRVTVSGPRQTIDIAAGHQVVESENAATTRPIAFDRDGASDVAVYDRNSLAAGTIQGPAIVEEAESTTVVPAGWRVTVREDRALLLERML